MDDLLDLDWSGKPQKPASNTPPAKPHKPSYLAGNPTTRDKKPPDAFAGLLNLPSEQKEPPLSLAEQQRRDRVAQWQPSTTASSSPTQALPTSSPAASLSLRTLSPTPKHSASGPPSTTGSTTAADTFDSLLDPFGKQTKTRSSNANKPLNALKQEAAGSPGGYFNQSHQEGQWNFDLLESKSTGTSSNEQVRSTGTRTPTGPIDPFDMDALSAEMPRARTTIPEIVNDDDNPLGILAGPAVKARSPSPPPARSPSPSPPPSTTELSPHSSASSGKDMLVAQLVDMGFEVEQAQVALEATGGRDLQEAIDLLVQNAEVVQAQQTSDTARARNAIFSDERSPAKSPRKQQHQKRPAAESEQSRASSRSGQSEIFSPVSLQQHKEKLMAQATELGGFLYKNASMFVKTGRERINKAMETWQEQQRAEQLYRQQGRPRWMTHDMDGTLEESADKNENKFTDKFVDDDSSDENPEEERRRELAWKKQQEAKRREYIAQMKRQQQREDAKLRAQKEQQEEVYISPSRRRAAVPRTSTRKQQPAPAPQTVSFPPVRPKVQRTRPVITAAPEALSRANQAREKGNGLFKLGQFGEAEVSYTQAIMALPSGHDHLVILFNNRAAARLKIGEYKKCIEDCTMAIDMAKASGEDNYEAQGITIQWKDQIAKGLSRKAEALENIEKYQDAMKAYEELVQMGGPHSAKASQGLTRCRKALNPTAKSSKPPSSPAAAAKPNENKSSGSAFPGIDYSIFEAKPAASAHVQNSKAVADLRAQAAQQEADEAERLRKTDDVNARITKWKAGKEQNLRALLATLDTLLWPGAMWRGAQMSELIDPKRCKMVYLKAIAKVHPDKLPSNVTIEQRMLASSIFSTLNEAWDVFKVQEKL